MNVEKLEKSTVKFTIEVSKEEFSQGLDKAFDIKKENVEVKGFRKGHVPRSYYEKEFGVESLYEEALNQIVPDKYFQAVSELKLYPVGHPDFDIKWETISVDSGFTFDCIVPVKPDVVLGEYKGLKVSKMNTEVTDNEVDSQIKALLNKDADLVVKESDVLEEGDTAIFDFDGYVDGNQFDGGKADNYELEIGSNQFIPGFETQMVGMKKEEEKEVFVAFPKEYHAANLAGKDAVFKVKLHDIKVREAKELNDEFVKGLNKTGIETVEALREDTKKSIQEQKTTQEKNRVIDELVEMATKQAKFELPDCMIEEEKNAMVSRVETQAKQYGMELDMFLMLNGTNKEDFMKDIATQAEKRVSYELVISQIMLNEKISASSEEIDAKLEELAKMYGKSKEEVSKQISPEQLSYGLSYEKTLDFLVENADLQ